MSVLIMKKRYDLIRYAYLQLSLVFLFLFPLALAFISSLVTCMKEKLKKIWVFSSSFIEAHDILIKHESLHVQGSTNIL